MLLVPHPSYRNVTSALLSKKIPTLPRYRLLVPPTSTKVRGNSDNLPVGSKTRQPQTTTDASFETNATFKKANDLFEAYDLSWKSKSRRHGRSKTKPIKDHAYSESSEPCSATAREDSKFLNCPPEIILHIVNFDLDNMMALSRTCKAFYQCLALNATRFWAELAIKKSGSLLGSGTWAIRRGCLNSGIFEKLSRLGAELHVIIEEAAFRGRQDIIQSVIDARGLAGSTPSGSHSSVSSESPSASKPALPFISDRSVTWASMMGHIYVVRLLLDLGGQATKEALVGAARNCRTQVVELLLERSPVGKLSTGEALEISLAYGRTDIAKLLLGNQRPLIPSTQLTANCMTCSQGSLVQPLVA